MSVILEMGRVAFAVWASWACEAMGEAIGVGRGEDDESEYRVWGDRWVCGGSVND
jgi:hypothetical protein